MKIEKKTVFRGFPRLFLRLLGSSGWRSVPLNEFSCESAISVGGSSIGSVLENGFSEARRLTQANTARDHRLVNTVPEMLANICHNLRTKIRPTVEHCHDDAANLEALVRARVAHLLDQPDNFHQTFERKILALYGGQEFIGSGKRIAHEDPKRRRAIDKNEIKGVVRQQWLERFRQTGEMIRHSSDLDLGTGKIDTGRHDGRRDD